MGTTPAFRNRSTRTVSSAGISSLKIGEPRVKGKPTAASKSLKANGKAVQRSDLLSSCHTPVGLVRQGQALVVVQLRHDGVDLGIHPLDLLQVRRHHFACRELARADQACQLASAHEAEIFGGGGNCR